MQVRFADSEGSTVDRGRPTLADATRSIAHGAAVLDIAVGTTVLLGWVTGVTMLKAFVPDLPAMKANAALLLVIAGATLWLAAAARPVRRWLIVVPSALIVLVAGLTIVEYVTGVDLGIDRLLAGETGPTPGSPFPGRMALSTAVAYLAAGLALITLGRGRRGGAVSELCGFVCATVGSAGLLGFAYGANALVAVGSETRISVPASIGLLVLGVGIAAADPRHRLVRYLTDSGPGGRLARRILPAVVIVVPVGGLLGQLGMRAGIFDAALGTVLVVVLEMVVLIAVAAWLAGRTVQTEAARDAAEQALRASEERYRTLIEQSSDAVFVLDPDGRLAEVNTAGYGLLGYEPDGLRGSPWAQLIAPDDLAARPLHLTDLEIGEPLRFERRLTRRDGTTVPVELSATLLSDGRLVHVARDITERVRTEAERARLVESLRRSQRDLEEAQQIAHIGSWTLDPGTGHATWSPEMYRILGLDPDSPAVDLADIARLFAPDSVRAVTTAIERAIETGEPWRVDLEVVRPGREHAWVSSIGIAERDDAGTATVIRGTMQDVTQQRALETQLRQSQKLESIGQLAGGIAHDFNNLLTAIRGNAELLGTRLATGDDDARECVDEIVAGADRATALVRQLLAFSRRQVLEPEVLDPTEVVEGIAPLLRRLIGEHVTLVTRGQRGSECVRVDRSQLEQVIVNLAVNAADAMPGGGILVIETAGVDLDAAYAENHIGTHPGPHVVLTVSDTGHGMDPATQTHVFEPFFTTKERGKGTGMGLATVYGIVQQSGGSIHLYSEPGRGTTFRIYLPRVDGPPTAISVAEVPRATQPGTEKILLVEDDPGVRGFAARVLAARGYSVLTAASGAEALVLAGGYESAIDLLITDVVMPGLQGPQLAAQLRTARPGIRVLYVSGFTEDVAVRNGSPDLEIAFLSKPFSGEALDQAVRAVLGAERTS